MLNRNSNCELGSQCEVASNAVLGLKYSPSCRPTQIGNNAVIREGTIIYGDTKIGNDFKSGHYVLIRENTCIGDNVLVGTHSIIDGNCTLGDHIKIQSNVYIPTSTRIGNNVFIGPCAVLLNDKYPAKRNFVLQGPIIEDDVTIGGNSTILPGVRIGKGSFVAAGAIVTKDVPPYKLAQGSPARFFELPLNLRERNKLDN